MQWMWMRRKVLTIHPADGGDADTNVIPKNHFGNRTAEH